MDLSLFPVLFGMWIFALLPAFAGWVNLVLTDKAPRLALALAGFIALLSTSAAIAFNCLYFTGMPGERVIHILVLGVSLGILTFALLRTLKKLNQTAS